MNISLRKSILASDNAEFNPPQEKSPREISSNDKTEELIQWMNGNGKRPPSRSKVVTDPEERGHAEFLGKQIRKKKNDLEGGTEKGIWFQSNEKMTDDAGYKGLFEGTYSATYVVDRFEKESNKKTEALILWMNNNDGRTPKDIPESQKGERFLSSHLKNRISSKKGGSGGDWHQSDEVLTDKAGYKGLFDGNYSKAFRKNKEEDISNQKTKALIAWVKKNKRTPRTDPTYLDDPSSKKKKTEEKTHAIFLGGRRGVKKGTSHGAWYKSDEKIAIESGYPGLFNDLIIEGKLFSIEELSKIKAEVYFLCDPTKKAGYRKEIGNYTFSFKYKPYYCGIGLLDQNRSVKHFTSTSLRGVNDDKNDKIKELLTHTDKNKLISSTVIKRCNILQALEVEREAIELFGRADRETGILLNHSYGGEFSAGKMFSAALIDASSKNVRKLIEWINKNRKYPRPNPEIRKGTKYEQLDREEKWLGLFLNRKTQAKNKIKSAKTRFYPSDQKLAKELGYPDLFEAVGRGKKRKDVPKPNSVSTKERQRYLDKIKERRKSLKKRRSSSQISYRQADYDDFLNMNDLSNFGKDDFSDNPNIKKVILEAAEELYDEFQGEFEFWNTWEDAKTDWESGEGFHADNDGGIEVMGTTTLSNLESSGQSTANQKLNEAISEATDQGYTDALEIFKDEYSEEIKDIPADKLDYSSLYDLGRSDLAEALSEREHDTMMEDTISFKFRIGYLSPERNKAQHPDGNTNDNPGIYLFFDVDGPGRNNIWWDEAFTFSTLTELKSKLDTGLNKFKNSFIVTREKISHRRMQ